MRGACFSSPHATPRHSSLTDQQNPIPNLYRTPVKKKPPSEKEIRASLVSRADVAITLGDLDSADVLLARALWMWPDETGSRKRAGVLLQKGDTTGYCIQTSMY